jgi:hypothetical protein
MFELWILLIPTDPANYTKNKKSEVDFVLSLKTFIELFICSIERISRTTLNTINNPEVMEEDALR